MPLESALDFNAYVDTTTGHGVTATFFEVQQSLWDQDKVNRYSGLILIQVFLKTLILLLTKSIST